MSPAYVGQWGMWRVVVSGSAAEEQFFSWFRAGAREAGMAAGAD